MINDEIPLNHNPPNLPIVWRNPNIYDATRDVTEKDKAIAKLRTLQDEQLLWNATKGKKKSWIERWLGL